MSKASKIRQIKERNMAVRNKQIRIKKDYTTWKNSVKDHEK